MKICQCCGSSSDAATCPNCGEASWFPHGAPVLDMSAVAAIEFKGRGLMSDADAAKFDPEPLDTAPLFNGDAERAHAVVPVPHFEPAPVVAANPPHGAAPHRPRNHKHNR